MICTVDSYQQLGEICEIDFDAKTIKISNAFAGVDLYQGTVGIRLSHVRNPVTNKDLINFTVETFDDAAMQFPVDILEFTPLLECNYPCFTCSGRDKDFCTSCWADDWNFPDTYLMGTDNWQTCKQKCCN